MPALSNHRSEERNQTTVLKNEITDRGAPPLPRPKKGPAILAEPFARLWQLTLPGR